jgi:hypothetical protein
MPSFDCTTAARRDDDSMSDATGVIMKASPVRATGTDFDATDHRCRSSCRRVFEEPGPDDGERSAEHLYGVVLGELDRIVRRCRTTTIQVLDRRLPFQRRAALHPAR